MTVNTERISLAWTAHAHTFMKQITFCKMNKDCNGCHKVYNWNQGYFTAICNINCNKIFNQGFLDF